MGTHTLKTFPAAVESHCDDVMSAEWKQTAATIQDQDVHLDRADLHSEIFAIVQFRYTRHPHKSML